MKIRVEFIEDFKENTIEVYNVDPIIDEVSEVSYVYGENNTVSAIVDVGFSEQGAMDRHKIKITWADGEVTETEYQYFDKNELCEGEYGVTGDFLARLTRPFGPGAVLYPFTVEVEDDDLGKATRTFQQLDLLQNVDDDNENQVVDRDDIGFNAEDDLKPIDLASLRPDVVHPHNGILVLKYDLERVRLWTDASKTTLILLKYAKSSVRGNPERPLYQSSDGLR